MNAAPAKNRNRARFNLRGRLALVLGAMGLCSVSLVGRAAYVQLINHDFYQRQGDARFLREIPIPTSRGMITDRNGEPVAVSSPVESVWGNPQELLKTPDRLPELAQALGVPLDHLTNRLSQKADKEFLYLKRRINPDEAQKILAHKIPGVFSQREFRRFYPQGPAMAHVLGFTNIDDRGQEGLELAFDEWLSGTPGAQKVIRDNRGRIVENVDLIRSAQPGKDRPETITVPARAVTRGPRHHWFGYYDKTPWDATGRYLLAMESTFCDRQPGPDDAITLGMVDLKSGNEWHVLDWTKTWCWQQGCMLQWLGSAPDKEVVYNVHDRGEAVAECRGEFLAADVERADGDRPRLEPPHDLLQDLVLLVLARNVGPVHEHELAAQ